MGRFICRIFPEYLDLHFIVLDKFKSDHRQHSKCQSAVAAPYKGFKLCGFGQWFLNPVLVADLVQGLDYGFWSGYRWIYRVNQVFNYIYFFINLAWFQSLVLGWPVKLWIWPWNTEHLVVKIFNHLVILLPFLYHPGCSNHFVLSISGSVVLTASRILAWSHMVVTISSRIEVRRIVGLLRKTFWIVRNFIFFENNVNC